MRARLSALAVVALAVPLAGCAGSPTPEEQRQEVIRPSGTPSPAFAPAGTPRNGREVKGEGFTIGADGAFVPRTTTSQNGEPALILQRGSRKAEVPVRVVVLREPEPRQDVIEQSYALEVSKRTVTKATDVVRSEVEWPEAERAVLVQWTETLQTGKGGTQARFWQLNVQKDPKLILVVVGVAPVAQFDGSGIPESMASFRLA